MERHTAPPSERTPPAGAGRGRGPLADRLVALVAACVCFLFLFGLLDTRGGGSLSGLLPAPLVPASVAERDALLVATVVDEGERPIRGASVRVFSLREERAYFAGERDTDELGRAELRGLPRGEAWVLAYAAGRARASSRMVLEAGTRETRLVLQPARALDVEVVDDRGEPVGEAEVRVTTADPLPYVGTADDAGKVRLDRLGPAPYVVRATASGYEEAQRTGVVPGAVPLRIRLDRSGALEVTVVTADGQPAEGATLLVVGPGLWPARSASADAKGVVRVAGLRAGTYDLKARRGDDVSATELAVLLARGETKLVRLTLGQGRRIRVVVTDGEPDPDRRGDAPPVAGASVVLAEQGLSSFPLYGRTDDRGVAMLGPVAPGKATVSARAAGFVPRTVLLADDGQTEARVPLVRGGAIVGDVVDDRGFPVSGASIEIVGVDPEGMPIDETMALTELLDDHFAFALSGPRPLVPMGELGVMPGPVPDLPRGAVGIARSGGGGGEPWVTRADGTFRAAPVPPGRVRAIVRHPSYVEAVSELRTLRSGGEETVHIVLREGGRLEGRVLEEDRTPVAGARVEISAMRGSFERVAYAADDGTFAFAAVPDEVLVLVSRPDEPGETAAREVVDVPDRDRKEVEIVLPKRRDALALHVTDDRGYPLDRVEVRAVSLDPAVGLRRTLFTNDDGDVLHAGVAALPLRLELRRAAKAPKILYFPSAPSKLDVALERAIEARGTVTARGGRERLAGASVTLYSAAGVRRTQSGGDGAFAFDELAPGRVRIAVRHDDYAPAEVVRSVGSDPERPFDLGEIDLPEAGRVEGVVLDERGDPVAGARVGRDAAPTFLPLGPLPPGLALTDKEGRFAMGGLPGGRVDLEAYAADLGRGAAEDVSVVAGRTTSRVTIRLDGERGAAADPKGGSVAVTLGERTAAGGKEVVVVMVPPGSEAEVAGIEPGDVLRAVSGRPATSIEKARAGLSGPLSEDVVLELSRPQGQNAAAPPGTESGTWLVRVRRERLRR